MAGRDLIGIWAMTNTFGHSIRSELPLLFVAEALIGFLGFYLILTWGLGNPREAAPAGLLLLAGGLAACSGLISGASGLYQPDAWQRVRRLLAGASPSPACCSSASRSRSSTR
jgi:hypothetical protein